jgi:hypothetical protein
VTGCGSSFHAVNQANSKSSKGKASSGVVACVCARHSLVQKNGVGDLQLGERYALVFLLSTLSLTNNGISYINTDYILASVLKNVTVQRVTISYDIACKWSIHLLARLAGYHPDLNIENFEFSYYVPKFHLTGHGSSCQSKYSFNYARGVGRTHGETVEQEWAHINLAALATREMGPGARHLTLDDNWSGWNWNKIVGMGKRCPFRVVYSSMMTRVYQAISSSGVY